MKFIVDAQLLIDLSEFFNKKGHNSIHTSQLPDKNFTSDNFIRALSVAQKRVVVTKDSDFYDSYILKKEPYKVVFVRTGNLKTSALINAFTNKFDQIISCSEQGGMIELTLENVKILY